MAVPVFRSSAAATAGAGDTVTIAAPTGLADNDILLATITAEPETQAITPPAGFASIARIDMASPEHLSLEVFWKRAASESGDYVFTETGNVWGGGAIAAISGCRTDATPIDVVGADNSGDSEAPTALSITTVAADCLLCFTTSSYGGFGSTAPSGMTERYDYNAPYLATLDFPTAGITGNKVSAIAGGTIEWLAVLLSLRPVLAASSSLADQIMMMGVLEIIHKHQRGNRNE